MAGRLRVVTVCTGLGLVLLLIAISIWIAATSSRRENTPTQNPKPAIQQNDQPSSTPTPQKRVTRVSIGNDFMISIPNGWSARISTQQSFKAIQVGTPGTIESLAYNESTPVKIDYSGIPSWNGLTEHFYARIITQPSQAFNPAAHANVTTDAFTFDDGTIGTKYSVTKDAQEAKMWGGLLKDSQWLGRVYVYKTDTSTIEAHFAYYPSTKVDHKTFENIARSIKP